MRIGIDARSLHYEGVGRYIRELTKHLATIDQRNKFILYFSSKKDIEENSIKQPNFHNAILPVTIYDLHKQPYLYYRLSRDNLDIFHATDHWLVPFLAPCPLVVTIHDTLVKTLKGCFSYKVSAYGTGITRIALAVSARIIAISDFTQKEIIDFYPKANGKISMIYHGVGTEFRPADESEISRAREKYQITKRYLLYVGSLKRHKNIPRLIEAFYKLSAPLIQKTELVIAARLEPIFFETVRLPSLLGIEKCVKFIGYVSTADLPGLYSGADALILPSLTEYFGFPIVEAMACGSPVIASKAGSIPEIGGDAAIYFDPGSVDEIKNAIERVLRDEGLREKLSNMGLKRSKEFSWELNTRKTLEIYESL